MDIELARSRDSSTLTIWCRGELDLATAPRLEHTILQALGEPVDAVILDLHRVTFFGSEGIHLIVTTEKTCRAAGIRLTVRANAMIRRVLEVTGVGRTFVLSEDRAEAPWPPSLPRGSSQ